jgi:predicted DNA-binding protein
MKNTSPKKQTRAEAAYVRDMAHTSALKKVDRGQARILSAEEFPEPLKRFAARELSDVHIRLPATARRRLRSLSQAKGIPPEELARQWVEQGLAREVG